jgi:SAM-dependent methyltransferase
MTTSEIFAPTRNALRDALRRHAPSLASTLGSFRLSEDRMLLAKVILPHLSADPAVQRLLFVGCDWYTQPYWRMFARKDYWTLDIDPDKRRFGGSRHVTDSLRNLRRHAQLAYFDAIVCNGVFMKTAIETTEEAEPSFEACFECLRDGGQFILGWNDTPELRPYPPSLSPALARFERMVFPPMGVDEHTTATSYRHTYTFFRRPHAPGLS